MYGQLFSLAYNNVYRISGADGDPQNPNDPYNVAPTLNGWQEFFQQWKSELRTRSR